MNQPRKIARLLDCARAGLMFESPEEAEVHLRTHQPGGWKHSADFRRQSRKPITHRDRKRRLRISNAHWQVPAIVAQ